jgi:murein DD-endopeptidase MepM/ murein hydrolase activator NlpD
MTNTQTNKHKRSQGKRLFSLALLGLFFILSGFMNIRAIETQTKVKAYELIVDGETWFVLEDVAQISQALESFSSGMVPDINENVHIVDVSFKQHIEIVPVEVERSKLNIIDNLYLKLRHQKATEQVYVVEKGDNVWKIAEKLGLSIDELERKNPTMDLDHIWPNDEIVITGVSHYLDVIVTLESKVEETINFKTITKKDASLIANTRKTVKEGVNGVKEVNYRVVYENGYEKEISVLSETIISEPIDAEVLVGTKVVAAAPSISNGNSGGTNFIVTTGRVSSDYGWRTHPITGKRSFHPGIDIANKVGTSILAYAGGTVTTTGWTNSYGNYIVIDHGGGLETYYIHLSGFDVSVGDSVSGGQLIGRMGKTGSATGSHLQFEVRVNGSAVNPWDYI